MATPTGAAADSIAVEGTRPVHPLKFPSPTSPRADFAGSMASSSFSEPNRNNHRKPPIKRERKSAAATSPPRPPSPFLKERKSRRGLGTPWTSTIVAALAVLLLCGRVGIVQAVCPNMCNGHGECGMKNVCECEAGWDLVADCSLKECPTGVSWGSKVTSLSPNATATAVACGVRIPGRLSSRKMTTPSASIDSIDVSVLLSSIPLSRRLPSRRKGTHPS